MIHEDQLDGLSAPAFFDLAAKLLKEEQGQFEHDALRRSISKKLRALYVSTQPKFVMELCEQIVSQANAGNRELQYLCSKREPQVFLGLSETERTRFLTLAIQNGQTKAVNEWIAASRNKLNNNAFAEGLVLALSKGYDPGAGAGFRWARDLSYLKDEILVASRKLQAQLGRSHPESVYLSSCVDSLPFVRIFSDEVREALLQQAADLGSISAKWQLNENRWQNYSETEDDYSHTQDDLIALADAGHIEALECLGRRYWPQRPGSEADTDLPSAHWVYKQLGKAGHLEAYGTVADLELLGANGRPDPEFALRCYITARFPIGWPSTEVLALLEAGYGGEENGSLKRFFWAANGLPWKGLPSLPELLKCWRDGFGLTSGPDEGQVLEALLELPTQSQKNATTLTDLLTESEELWKSPGLSGKPNPLTIFFSRRGITARSGFNPGDSEHGGKGVSL